MQMTLAQIEFAETCLNVAHAEILAAKKALELVKHGGRYEPQANNVIYGAVAARRNLNNLIRISG